MSDHTNKSLKSNNLLLCLPIIAFVLALVAELLLYYSNNQYSVFYLNWIKSYTGQLNLNIIAYSLFIVAVIIFIISLIKDKSKCSYEFETFTCLKTSDKTIKMNSFILSIVLIVVPVLIAFCLLLIMSKYSYTINKNLPFIYITWLFIISLPVVSFVILDYKKTKYAEFKLKKDEIFFLITLLIFIILILLPYITVIPYNIEIDEAATGNLAREISSRHLNLLDVNRWFGYSNLCFLPAIYALKYLSNDITGLRLLSVLSSLILILPFYYLSKFLFNKNIAAIASIILFSSHCFIYFFRTAYIFNQGLIVLVIVLFLFISALKTNSKLLMYLAGTSCGFGMYAYFSARALIPILVVYSVFLTRDKTISKKCLIRYILTFILGFTLVSFPVITFSIMKPQYTIFRANEISIFNKKNTEKLKRQLSVNNKNLILLKNTGVALTSFIYNKDKGQYKIDRPFLEVITSVLFLLGLIIVIKNFRQNNHFLLFATFFIIVFLAWCININTPTFQKMVIILPVTSLIAALALNKIVISVETILINKKFKTFVRYGFSSIILIAIVISNLEFFFYEYIVNEKDYSFYNARVIAANIINRYTNKFDIIILNTIEDRIHDLSFKNQSFKFILNEKIYPTYNIEEVNFFKLNNINQNTCFIIKEDYSKKSLEILKRVYPYGYYNMVYDNRKKPVVLVYIPITQM